MPEPFRTDDELVSAVLDGEATADERSRVAADPALSARLAEFAAVADALSLEHGGDLGSAFSRLTTSGVGR